MGKTNYFSKKSDGSMKRFRTKHKGKNTRSVTLISGDRGVPLISNSRSMLQDSEILFSQDELTQLKVMVNKQAKKTLFIRGQYYMTQLLKVLSKRDKSAKGKMIFDHFIQNIKSIKYISSLQLPTDKMIEEKHVDLPPQKQERKIKPLKSLTRSLEKKFTLIFDLDETLVHCEHSPMISFDHIISIDAPSGEIVDVSSHLFQDPNLLRRGLKSDHTRLKCWRT
jgi:hypothetical protein